VRISGGATLQKAFKPRFAPGSYTYNGNGCVSAVNRLGPCRKEPCTVGGSLFASSLYRGSITVPEEFADGRSPAPLTASMFHGVLGLTPGSRGTGAPHIKNAYVVNRFGSRVRVLLGPGKGTTTVKLAYDAIDAFSIEATVGGRKPDWVHFERDGKTVRYDSAAPWGMTGELPEGGWKDWGGWTSGKTHDIRITPEGGSSRTFRLRVYMP